MLSAISKSIHALKLLRLTNQSYFNVFTKGYSVASTEIIYNVSKYCQHFDTIIDVGANIGQFALASTKVYPQANIYSFEPVPDTFKELSNNVRDISKIHIFNLALGSEQAEINFYKNNYSHASSALPVSEFQQINLPKTSVTETIKVPVNRLDLMLDQVILNGSILLKLDVQGFEKEVLIGSKNILEKVDFILFEASFVPMYDGEPTFNEMNNYVQSLGFEFLAPMGVFHGENLQILQMDALYKRKGTL